MIHHTAVMKIPSHLNLDFSDEKILIAADQSYMALPSQAFRSVLNWVSLDPSNAKTFKGFDHTKICHELSSLVLDSQPEQSVRLRSITEIHALGRINPPPPMEMFNKNFCYFEQFLSILSRQIGFDGEYRTKGVRTTPDVSGSYALYPNASFIRSQLRKLFDFCCYNISLSPFFCATVLMNGLCNIHPFMDGNGRISRMVFNWLLSGFYGKIFYLPISELAAISESGFVIRQRQAQYFDNWTPLLSFLSYSVQYFASTSIAS